MIELRLFEIGFRDRPSSPSYSHKFYIAALDSDDALDMARQKIVEDEVGYWENEGRMMAIFDAARKAGVSDDVPDDEVLSNADFITSAEEQHEKELERLRNLHHARTQDCGLVIV